MAFLSQPNCQFVTISCKGFFLLPIYHFKKNNIKKRTWLIIYNNMIINYIDAVYELENELLTRHKIYSQHQKIILLCASYL